MEYVSARRNRPSDQNWYPDDTMPWPFLVSRIHQQAPRKRLHGIVWARRHVAVGLDLDTNDAQPWAERPILEKNNVRVVDLALQPHLGWLVLKVRPFSALLASRIIQRARLGRLNGISVGQEAHSIGPLVHSRQHDAVAVSCQQDSPAGSNETAECHRVG